MEDNIKQYVYIMIAAMLMAIILTVGSVLGTASRNLLSYVTQEKVHQRNIALYNKLYMYDNKIVRGTDVVEAMLRYARNYNFIIQIDSTEHKFIGDKYYKNGSLVSIPTGVDIWSQEYIINDVLNSKNITAEFNSYISEEKGKAIDFSSGYDFSNITTIEFVKK